MRQDSVDQIHLISKCLIQHLQIEHIAELQFIQVREHLLIGHTGMCGQDAVGTFTTHRQRASQQVADTHFQSIGIGTMVNGQIHLDQGDLYIAHGPIPCQIQLMLVIFRCPQKGFLREGIA